jgi:hypothetical protein
LLIPLPLAITTNRPAQFRKPGSSASAASRTSVADSDARKVAFV